MFMYIYVYIYIYMYFPKKQATPSIYFGEFCLNARAMVWP